MKTKIYDKRDDFDVVNFPFLDGDVPRSASYGVYISQLIRFARVSSHVDDFNTRNKVLTAKLLRQGYWFKLVYLHIFYNNTETVINITVHTNGIRKKPKGLYEFVSLQQSLWRINGS